MANPTEVLILDTEGVPEFGSRTSVYTVPDGWIYLSYAIRVYSVSAPERTSLEVTLEGRNVRATFTNRGRLGWGAGVWRDLKVFVYIEPASTSVAATDSAPLTQ